MVEIIREIVQELSPLAEEKEIHVKIDTSNLEKVGDNAAFVTGDRMELRRVIANLLGNAIKFTDAGSITIRVSETLLPVTGQEGVTIKVEDTGYGIASEDLPQLFERFRQGKNKRAGSGLGLHLSHRIVETHGGTIEASSELGRGSVFTVHLPKAEVGE